MLSGIAFFAQKNPGHPTPPLPGFLEGIGIGRNIYDMVSTVFFVFKGFYIKGEWPTLLKIPCGVVRQFMLQILCYRNDRVLLPSVSFQRNLDIFLYSVQPVFSFSCYLIYTYQLP